MQDIKIKANITGRTSNLVSDVSYNTNYQWEIPLFVCAYGNIHSSKITKTNLSISCLLFVFHALFGVVTQKNNISGTAQSQLKNVIAPEKMIIKVYDVVNDLSKRIKNIVTQE